MARSDNFSAFGDYAIPKLLGFVKRADLPAPDKEQALQYICDLNPAHQETKIKLIEQGLVSCLTGVISDSSYPPTEQMLILCLKLLAETSSVEQGRSSLSTNSTVPVLVNLFSHQATKTTGT